MILISHGVVIVDESIAVYSAEKLGEYSFEGVASTPSEAISQPVVRHAVSKIHFYLWFRVYDRIRWSCYSHAPWMCDMAWRANIRCRRAKNQQGRKMYLVRCQQSNKNAEQYVAHLSEGGVKEVKCSWRNVITLS